MSRKVYLHYQEGDDEDRHMTLKLTLPKKWVAEGSPVKVLELFIESYNKRKGEHTLVPSGCHLEGPSGTALCADDVIGDVMADRDDFNVRPGSTQPGKSQVASQVPPQRTNSAVVEPAGVPQKVGQARCRNYGCNKFYSEEENTDTACAHHTGPPIFHDTKKGWSCCDKRVYDWDEFQAIVGCATGRHSSSNPTSQFAPRPSAVAAADDASQGANISQTKAVRSIADYNSSNPAAVTAASSAVKAMAAAPKCTRRPDGTAKCLNKGCQKDFVVIENTPDACKYHKQAPVFHDTGKFWGCCPDKVKFEFDDFLGIPGCSTGYHQDGSGEFSNPQ